MSIDGIKERINNNLGNKIIIQHNEGRNKIYEYTGKIIEVYNNIFIILEDKNSCKMSFSYYDVLTRTVKISFKL